MEDYPEGARAMKIATDFVPALEGLDMEKLDESPDVVYALREDLSLAYFNASWETFARRNGGDSLLEDWGLGACVLDAITNPKMREFYRSSYAAVTPDRPFRHDFDCPSGQLFRRVHSHVQVLAPGPGLLILNTLVEETPMGERHGPPADRDIEELRQPNGVFTQCAECRRTATSDRSRWVWAPELVRAPQQRVSHGLCPICIEVYSV